MAGADLVDGKHAHYAGGLGAVTFVSANAATAQGSTILAEGSYTLSVNAPTHVCMGSLGVAPTVSNGFLVQSAWPLPFSVGPTDGGVVGALAVSGTSGVWIVRRQ